MWPRGNRLANKPEVKKSRDTVPLRHEVLFKTNAFYDKYECIG
jgi:hypothetical protein